MTVKNATMLEAHATCYTVHMVQEICTSSYTKKASGGQITNDLWLSVACERSIDLQLLGLHFMWRCDNNFSVVFVIPHKVLVCNSKLRSP